MHRKDKILCASALLLSASFAASSTLAWYASQSFLTADRLDFSFASSSLLLGVEKEGSVEYKESLNEEDIKPLCPTFFSSLSLSDVSGMFGSRWEKEERPRLYALTGKEANEGSYLQFPLYLYAEEDAEIYLDESTLIAPDRERNHERASSNHESEAELNRIVDSLRLSFRVNDDYVVLRLGEDASPIDFAGPLDVDPEDGYFDYADGKEILYGDYRGEPRHLNESQGPHHRDGIAPLDPTSYQARQEVWSHYKDHIYGMGKPLFSIQAKKAQKVYVTLYAEGWDPLLTRQRACGAFRLHLALYALFKE